MKEIILSADGESGVYLVPDIVAENLREYCIEFCDNWLLNSPEAKQYRTAHGVCYNEADFIVYLNTYVFLNQESKFIKSLGRIELRQNLPSEYKSLPYFNF